MKIGIQTWGSNGDIRPLIALAAGLQAAGHQISMVATDVDDRHYHHYAKEHGFRFRQVATPVLADAQSLKRIAERIDQARTPAEQSKIIIEQAFLPARQAMHQAAAELAEENTLLIGHFFLYPLQIEAEKRSKPYITASFAPILVPSRHLCPTGLPNWGKWINPLWWKLAQIVLNRQYLPAINDFRMQQGLPPQRDTLTQTWISDRLNLIAASPQLIQRPSDWPDKNQLCGYFDLPETAQTDELPADIKTYLQAGPPPIYIGFGSLTPADEEQYRQHYHLIDEALKQSNQRGIVQLPLQPLKVMPSSPRILSIGHVSHRALFPHCALAIHHGGAGTTHTAARAGLPSIIIAHAADQYYWGEQLHKLGIAPKHLDIRKLTASGLTEAIHSVTQSATMKPRAQAIARAMQQEQGVANAIDHIERLAKTIT
ncbi:MAG: glycosyltransferase family 1 protein [Betaproteobacteria bacterium]|nr:glycosyltransferase family 1 protein [Betaproteobacteria bacterium]